MAGTGNSLGLSQAEFEALPETERRTRLVAARAELERAGAHYVVDNFAELDVVLDEIDARLRSSNDAAQAFLKES